MVARNGNEAGRKGLLPVEDALRIVLGAVSPVGVEEIGLDGAAGRVLAEEVRAPEDMPPFDRSMMDGYALRAADTEATPSGQAAGRKSGEDTEAGYAGRAASEPPTGASRSGRVLEVIGFLPAGAAALGFEVGPAQAVRIMTGAPIPHGADAVVMFERTEPFPGGSAGAEGTRRVRVLRPARAGENIARRGEDLAKGDTILAAGSWIRAAEVGALAAAGRIRFLAHRAPVIRVLSTGDELVDPAETPLPHQIRNSNGPAILAALSGAGVDAASLGTAPDDPAAIDAKLAEGLSGHLLLVIGGVSVGDRDLVSERLKAAGVIPLFHKVAVKPGKPLFFGRRGDCLVFGLPGNPLSALTAFLVFALPAVRRLMGLPAEGLPELRARLEGRLSQKPGRTWFRLAHAAARSGELVAAPVRSSGSGDLASASRANAFIIVPADTAAIEDGESVRVLLWPGFELR